MIIIILASVLVLAIAFYQAIQGLFSALIMTVLTVLCACISLNYYEGLAEMFPSQPLHAQTGTMLALFIIPLIALRFLADKFLFHNVVTGVWSDRIGGGLLGLITGMVMTGILGIAVQLLPMGAKPMGWLPYNGALERDERMGPFRPDEFTLGMVKMLSGGSLSGSQTLASVHDDLLLEAFCCRNTAGKNGSIFTTPDALTVLGYRELAESKKEMPWTTKVPNDPLMPRDAKRKIVVVGMEAGPGAAEGGDSPASGWFYLPATHFRLVTTKGQSHYPVGYLDANFKTGELTPMFAKDAKGELDIPSLICQRKPIGTESVARVMWIYCLGSDEEPEKIVFRRFAESQTLKELHMAVEAFPRRPAIVKKGAATKPAVQPPKAGVAPAGKPAVPAAPTAKPTVPAAVPASPTPATRPAAPASAPASLLK